MKNNQQKKKQFFQILKFILFSISAGIVQGVAFSLMTEVVKSQYWLSYLVALVLSVLWNFTFNRKFTFGSSSNVPKAMLLALIFYIPFAPLSTIGGDALTNAGWNEYLVLFLTMVVNLSLEFLWQKFVVFRDSYVKEKTK